MADEPVDDDAPQSTTATDESEATADDTTSAEEAAPAEAADAAPTDGDAGAAGAGAEPEGAGAEATAGKEKAAAASAPVVRKKVVSKRVTPKGGPAPKASTSGPTKPRTKASTTAKADDDDHSFSKRYTPPAPTYKAGPSPWWVPALMFGLIIVGALVIMLNYMQVFGDPKNIRLVIGLAFILGGIITATQYR